MDQHRNRLLSLASVGVIEDEVVYVTSQRLVFKALKLYSSGKCRTGKFFTKSTAILHRSRKNKYVADRGLVEDEACVESREHVDACRYFLLVNDLCK